MLGHLEWCQPVAVGLSVSQKIEALAEGGRMPPGTPGARRPAQRPALPGLGPVGLGAARPTYLPRFFLSI